ncbi:MAG: hypothetical protein LBC99_03700 [Spirochaetota bacterium]|jgi:hypothetical protein|nr:hypothetical protein [Spirochaetota bacterium]
MDEYVSAFVDALGTSTRGYGEKFAKNYVEEIFDFADTVFNSTGKKLCEYTLSHRFISDGAIIVSKTGDNFLEHKFFLATAAIIIYVSMLPEKALFETECLLRGGIAYDSLHMGKHSMFGQVFVDAYKVESKAIYPLIVIHKQHEAKPFEEKERIKNLLRKNFDDMIYVWPLVVCITDSTISEHIEIFSKMKRGIPRKKNIHDDPYIIQKYAWWANVMNAELKKYERINI